MCKSGISWAFHWMTILCQKLSLFWKDKMLRNVRKNEWQGSNFTAYIRNRKIIVVLEPGLLLIFFNPTPLPLLNICTQREEIPQLQFDSTIETEFAFPTSVLEDNFWREIPFSVGQVSAIFPAQLPRSPVDTASRMVRVKEIASIALLYLSHFVESSVEHVSRFLGPRNITK